MGGHAMVRYTLGPVEMDALLDQYFPTAEDLEASVGRGLDAIAEVDARLDVGGQSPAEQTRLLGRRYGYVESLRFVRKLLCKAGCDPDASGVPWVEHRGPLRLPLDDVGGVDG